MKNEDIISGRFLCFLNLLIFSVFLKIAYDIFLQPSNEYLGYQIISSEFEYWERLLPCILISMFFLPNVITRPSDFFFLFYGILVVIPYAVLHQIQGYIELDRFALNMSLITGPAIIIKMIVNMRVRIKFPKLISTAYVVRIYLFVLIGVVTYAILVSPNSAGFDIETSYVRRLEAREIFLVGSLMAYMTSIVMNSCLPFLAYYAGLKDQKSYLICSIISFLAFYYILGIKGPFLILGMAWLLGVNNRLGNQSDIAKQIWLILLLLFLTFFIEYYFLDYSYVGDYLLRRLLTVPPEVMAFYFDLIENSLFDWKLWSGIDAPNGVTYLVGELYMHNAQTNANTNCFIDKLAAGGILYYFGIILLVGMIFNFIDGARLSGNDDICLFVGFLYTVLIMEQSATTALLSSGVGFLLMLLPIMGQRIVKHDKFLTIKT